MEDYRWGTQPARRIMVLQGVSEQRAADECGVRLAHMHNVLYGRTRPSDAIRQLLPRLLQRSLSECFTDEALAEEFDEERSANSSGHRMWVSHAGCGHPHTASARRYCRIGNRQTA